MLGMGLAGTAPGTAWPTRHAELSVVIWAAAALIALFAPLSVRLYRRKVL